MTLTISKERMGSAVVIQDRGATSGLRQFVICECGLVTSGEGGVEQLEGISIGLVR